MKLHYYKEDIINICDCNHLTVEEIFEIIQKKYPNAWRSSIYRNVEELASSWDLVKIEWIGKKAYFEKKTKNHMHVIDKNTWKIVDLFFTWNTFPKLPDDFKADRVDIKVFWTFAS